MHDNDAHSAAGATPPGEPATSARTPLLRLAAAAIAHPRRTVVVFGLLTALAAAGLLRLDVRTDGATIYPLDNRTVLASSEDRQTFGDPEQVIVLVTSRDGGPAVASPVGFAFLAGLHREIDALPAVESGRVRSLADLLQPPEGPDSPYVRAYFEALPLPPEEFRRLLDRLREHPLTDGLFLSPDGRAAALYVPLVGGEDRLGQAAALERRLGELPEMPFDLRLTGPVIAEARLGETVLADLAWLTPLMVAAIALLLLASLRTAGGVAVTMIEVLVVLLWTMGAMAWSGVPLTLVTTILPVVLLAMAVTDEIHLLERFQAHLAAGAHDGGRDVRRALAASLAEIERPIVLTSLTTSLGFLSFLAASIAPIRHFGLFTALGIVVAMVSSFSLVPALVTLLPARWFAERRRGTGPRPAGAGQLGGLLAGRSGWALAAGIALLLALAPGIALLEVQDSWVDNFDPDSAIATADRDFNAHFWGSYRFDVVLDGPREGFFHSPQGLRLLEELERVVAGSPAARGEVSHLVAVEIVAEGWGEPLPVSALSEPTLSRISAWLRLIRNRIDLERFLTPDARSARARLLVNSPDFRKGRSLAEELESRLGPAARAAGVELHFSGDLPLAVEVVRAIVTSQLASIAWTVAGIALLLIVALRRFTLAVAMLVPVTAAAAMVFGTMGYLGVPLGIATSMFAALTLGVGLDFALHFGHRYLGERRRGAAHPAAVAATLATSGRAIRWNALVLALGFSVLTFSALKPNRSLGLLLAAALATCYLTTHLFLPALLEHLAGREARRAAPERLPERVA